MQPCSKRDNVYVHRVAANSIDFKKPRDPRLRVQHFVMPHLVGHQSPWTNLVLEFNRNIEAYSISL